MIRTTRILHTTVVIMLACANGLRAQTPPQGKPDVPTMVAVQDLAWSADGRALFFSAMRVKPDYSDYTPDKWAVYRYDLRAKRLTTFAGSSFSVCASPVDERVVVGTLSGGNRDLYALGRDGQRLTRLTTDPAEDFGCSWSPDGRRIAFTSKRDGHAEVYVANSDGTEPRRLTRQASARSLNPSWSPDGRSLAYYYETGDGQDQIHVMNADGTGDINVTNDAFNNVFPGWTPEGRVIYGQGVKGKPTTRVFTVGRDGMSKQPLLNIDSFYARVSPDGTKIAYVANAGAAGASIALVDRTGAGLTIISLGTVGGGAATGRRHVSDGHAGR
jgi:TolB protein